MSEQLQQFIIVAGFGALCFGWGYLSAFMARPGAVTAAVTGAVTREAVIIHGFLILVMLAALVTHFVAQ